MAESESPYFKAIFRGVGFPLHNLTQPMDPEKENLNFIFPTKYVIPKSLKFSHWLTIGQVSNLKCYEMFGDPTFKNNHHQATMK